MRLRQICDTPALFMDDYQGASGKLDSLRDLLLTSGRWRASCLDFLPVQRNVRKNRARTPQTWAWPPSKSQVQLLLMTDRRWLRPAQPRGKRCLSHLPKAGGVGLNLTGADTVILVDLWWRSRCRSPGYRKSSPHGAGADGRGLSFDYQGDHWRKKSKNFKNKKHLVSQVLDGTESRAVSVWEIREILGISEASTWKIKTIRYNEVLKGNTKWNKIDFHWCQMMRSWWPKMPVMDLWYDESDFISNIKGEYR